MGGKIVWPVGCFNKHCSLLSILTLISLDYNWWLIWWNWIGDAHGGDSGGCSGCGGGGAVCPFHFDENFVQNVCSHFSIVFPFLS